MIVRSFLRFIKTANAAERAAGANALARAYLQSPLEPEEFAAAEAGLSVLCDDPSPSVRLALADGLAAHPASPRHVVLTLAADQPEIATIILARSPVLLDSELVEQAARGDQRIQRAVAERRPLGAPVAAALAEIGTADTCAALLENDAAALPVFALARIVDRHGEDAVIRNLALARDDLPVGLRQKLVADLSNVLGAFVVARSWLSDERARALTREALDRATLGFADTEDAGTLEELVAHLVATGQLTAILVLRALCAGNVAFLEEALVQLSGLARTRVGAHLHEPSSAGFAAVYRKAGLPEAMLPAFETALDVIAQTEVPDSPAARAGYARRVLERVLTRYRGFSAGETDQLLMMLRRFASEAAREEARHIAEAFAREDVKLIAA